MRKNILVVAAILLMASLFVSCKQEVNSEKVVVLTFDDAVKSHLTYVAPLLREKGFGATFFISREWMDDSTNFLTWEEVARIHEMGFEIGNHAWVHAPMYTPEVIGQMEKNLGRVDSALAAHGIPKPVCFAYTSNFYAPGTVEKIRELGYRFARRGMQPEFPYGKIVQGPLFDPEVSNRLVIPTTADAYPDWTLEHFKKVIARAEPGKAVILQFHGVPDEAHPWVHTDPELFKACMDYLEETGLPVIALKDLDQHFTIGDVEDPALHYTHGVPGRYNPCPQDADVWVLAGQSNMQGAGRTPDTLMDPQIWMMNLDNQWSQARCPIHRIFEAKAPAYALAWHELNGDKEKGFESTRAMFKRNAERSKYDPIGGVGPGIYFARQLHEHTGRPIGLIPCALGGSTIEQWNPAGLARGDSTLYGAMIGRIRQTNPDQLKGLVWYQGESEAMLGIPDTYEEKFLRFIDAFREDVGKPDLPVIYVQIGRMNIDNPQMGKHWEAIREIQRQAVFRSKNLYFTTAIDLEYDDVVHHSTESNMILGQRLGNLALSYVYDLPGYGKQIEPESMELVTDSATGSPCLKITYRGVSGSLRSLGNASSFQLRFGEDTHVYDVVSRIRLDPADPTSVFLHLSRIPGEPARLYCGPGIHPCMNITDSLNMPLPAFGPVDIDFEKLNTNKIYF
jgi:peptidoglycan/xylan/chitin deacetylase (PgdA/CDA1 family)